MLGNTQQMEQCQNAWIQIKQLATAGHLDAVALSIGTEYAGLGIACQLLKDRQLAGIELRSERFQNRAEVLIKHRGEVRVVVSRKQRMKRDGAGKRSTVCVGLQRGKEQGARGGHNHVAVREGIVVLGGKHSALQ